MADVEPLENVQGIKLHIGGKEVHPDWKILNIQANPGVDFVGDCVDLSRFPENSIAEVYASHVYEHLSYQGDLVKAFAGVYRVLQPGGMFRVSVPDLHTLCEMFIDSNLPAETRFLTMRMIYGGQTDAYDYHKVGLTAEFIGLFLGKAGFKKCRRVHQFGIFHDTSKLQVAGRFISLNVEAVK